MKLWFVMIGLLWSHALFGTTPVIEFNSSAEQVAVAPVLVFKDQDHTYDFQSITRHTDWSVQGQENFNFGFSPATYWFHFKAKNASDRDRNLILEIGYPLLDYLELKIVRQDGTSELKQSGDRRNFDTRDIDHRNISFLIETAAGETVSLFLRAQTESSVQGPLRLWSPEAFIAHSAREQTVFSIYAGIMIAMVFYNLFLYIKLRLLSQLYYILYLFFFMYSSFALYGWAFQFLTPGLPALSNFLGPFSISVSGVFLFLFSQEFLQLKQRHPYLYRGGAILRFLGSGRGCRVLFFVSDQHSDRSNLVYLCGLGHLCCGYCLSSKWVSSSSVLRACFYCFMCRGVCHQS